MFLRVVRMAAFCSSSISSKDPLKLDGHSSRSKRALLCAPDGAAGSWQLVFCFEIIYFYTRRNHTFEGH